jgi:hypothetical protein
MLVLGSRTNDLAYFCQQRMLNNIDTRLPLTIRIAFWWNMTISPVIDQPLTLGLEKNGKL